MIVRLTRKKPQKPGYYWYSAGKEEPCLVCVSRQYEPNGPLTVTFHGNEEEYSIEDGYWSEIDPIDDMFHLEEQ